MNTPLRNLFGLAIALLLPTFVAAAAEQQVTSKRVTIAAKSGAVSAELFDTNAAGKRPVVIVLHGAGGTLLDGPEMRRVARHLAASGNTVYVLHYFERTGTLFARDATMQENFGTWLATVRDSIAAVQQMRGDSAPLGIYGYSLGAFLALQAASDNPRVGAVVEHAGGVWNGKFERIGKMPPVLMIHGRRDARVPFAKYAEPLVSVLRKRAATLETRFFPDEGHGFTPAAMTQVRDAAARFFAAHLRPGTR